MTKTCEPRRFLRRISNELLHTYFNNNNIHLAIEWDTLTKRDWKTIHDAWLAIDDDDTRCRTIADFQEVHSLATENGIRMLRAEAQRHNDELARAFDTLPHRHDMAMYAFLHHQHIWRDAARFADAQSLAGSRYWHRYSDIDTFSPHITATALTQLETCLSAFYREQESRGQYCRVEHSQRQDGQHFFFAYLEDHPTAGECFDNGELQKTINRGVFEVFFSCSQQGDFLDVYATGNKQLREDLLRLFGCCIVGENFNPETASTEKSYRIRTLGHQQTFATDPEDNISDARIRALTVRVRGGGKRQLKMTADPDAGPNDIYRILGDWLNHKNVPLANIEVLNVEFGIRFISDQKRKPGFAFSISSRGSCTLRSKSEKLRLIGEKYLEKWGITGGQSYRSAA